MGGSVPDDAKKYGTTVAVSAGNPIVGGLLAGKYLADGLKKSGKVDAPDNSALVQAQEKQQEILDKKAAEINKQKQQKLQNTADSANARRRSQMSMSSLIKTSENGLLGSVSKLGK